MKHNKGSLLIVSMLILSMILMIGLTMSLTSVKNQKSTMESAKSIQSFQSADNGVEAVLSAIKNASSSDTISQLVSDISGASCSAGIISSHDGTYSVEFFDDLNAKLACTADISDIDRIKSSGKDGSGQTRAIEAAVAAGNMFHCVNVKLMNEDYSGMIKTYDSNSVTTPALSSLVKTGGSSTVSILAPSGNTLSIKGIEVTDSAANQGWMITGCSHYRRGELENDTFMTGGVCGEQDDQLVDSILMANICRVE